MTATEATGNMEEGGSLREDTDASVILNTVWTDMLSQDLSFVYD